MKKISFVLIALLALVAFTGCPTAHDDYDYATVPDLFIVGAPNYNGDNVFTKMTPAAGTTTQTYEFTYATAMSANWESPADGIAFVITDGDGSWTKLFCDVALTLGGGYATSGADTNNNATVAGLTAGTAYVITIDYSAKPYKAKIDAK